MEFVINEWVPEYFRPDSSNEEKQNLGIFLNKLLANNDKIFVRRPSEFLRKIQRYANDYQSNYKIYLEIKKFITIILQDSNRCVFVDDNDFELSEDVINKLIEGGNTISDKYLFEAAAMTESKIIITTDVKLKNLMRNNETFKVELLSEFLINY